MSEKIYVSQSGLEKMRDDLVKMGAERLKIAAQIEQARDLGDLSENAEYHAAKEAQAHLHARIRDLEDKVARAQALEDHDIDESKAYVGSTVKVLNKKTGKELIYMLVSPVEADTASGRISTKSPVGQALLGKSAGEIAVANVPAGNLEFKILEVSR